uniref:Uncharacterized protein n=1 Tax=Oryza sativa subsp. japonica TaxID=39947 RepID=Q6YVV2_ORYSJ|nr:hypothetical protein [Oryza sativa Japonica Group]
MAAGPPAPIPSPPAALSPFQPYINPPRASSVRFRLSPPFLLDGIELAPSLSLSAVAVELRSAVVVTPDHLPPRRRLLRLHRILGDLVHPSVSLADRRNAAVPIDPSRAAAFLHYGCLSVVAVDLG